MPKKREKSSSEYHLGIIRSLKSEIRNLKKRIKELERFSYNQEQAINAPPEEIDLPISYREPCIDCGKGFMNEVIIFNRSFKQCDVCSFRTKAKII